MIKMRKLIALAVTLLFIVTAFFPKNIFANPDFYDMTGTSIMLVERNTGRILYERNADMLIYPASMIKVLTAIVMLDHLELDEIFVVGTEIQYVPFGSSVVGHVWGEHITGLNLLRGLMLPSGNDTANVVAAQVANRVSGLNLPFQQAEAIFTDLMNERARQIGLTSSNFTNAHGFHDPLMQVTARDLIALADYAIGVPAIRQVAGEINHTGHTVPENHPDFENILTRQVNWNNTNRMLVGIFHHPHVTGLKTGFHTPAGHTFLGTAEHNGIELISVIGGSYNETRFVDTARLFDYAFENYDFHLIHVGLNLIDEIEIHNPRWGDANYRPVFGTTNFVYFLNFEERNAVEQEIIFFDEFMYRSYYNGYNYNEDQPVRFVAPLYAGNIIGRVVYTLDGQELFFDHIVVTEDIIAWSYIESFWFVVNYLRENPFSILGLSVILGLIFLSIITGWLIGVIRRIYSKHNRVRRIQRTKFKL